MIICLAFIGKLPKYTIYNIHQIRCFYSGIIYLITNDLKSNYIEEIIKYNVIIIDYNLVIDNLFLETVEINRYKFCIVNDLIGREELFIRCFERFFVLNNLLKHNNLNDCLFLELDNLIYDDPKNWIEKFSKNELCYMYDNERRFSSGLMYVKNNKALEGFLDSILNFINYSNEFLTEMTVLSIYYENNKDKVEILPTYWKTQNIPAIAYENIDKYDSLFDALAIGCNLLGIDPIHTNGVIQTNLKAGWCAIDYTKQIFEWKIDENNLRRPYVWNGEKWLLVNNLHVHSKDLINGLSKTII
jgi:hypothetical protein